jgi:hypothetical protein
MGSSRPYVKNTLNKKMPQHTEEERARKRREVSEAAQRKARDEKVERQRLAIEERERIEEETARPGKEKRADILRKEIAEGRAKRAGMVAVETPEGWQLMTFEEARATPSVEQQKKDIERREMGEDIKETLPFRKELIEKTGAGEEGLAGIPSLEPDPIRDSLKEFFGDPGERSSAELAEMQRQGISPLTPEQEARRGMLGLSAVGIGLALGAGFVGYTFLATRFASASAFQAASSLKVWLTGGTAVAGTAIAMGGFGSLQDFERADITVQTSIIAGIVSSGERLESMTNNGAAAEDSLQSLSILNDAINRAEQIIFEKGNLNLRYRTSKEYEAISIAIWDARNVILRRTDAVINIGTLGTAAQNPQILMLQGQEMLDYANNPLGVNE